MSKFLLSTGKSIEVRDLEWEQHSAASDKATCQGFGLLVICDLLLCHDMEDVSGALSLAEVTELQTHLDLEATVACTQAGIDQRERGRKRA